ncbi:MAG: HlyD family efflux transporter periplasmic adaptor subunit [Cytophagales bacterium]|nr:MAG: HlyD family efflux transporter periplasmic adaptor subunit [Cytophagales bacterium]
MLGISANDSNIDDKIYKQKLSSSEVLLTPRAAKVLVFWLLGFFLLFLITLFLPWQQNIQATGDVTALRPQDRPQTVESAIAGRIIRWGVAEGQFVHKGDTILQLAEIKDKFFDPELLTRLEEQLQAKKSGLVAYNSKTVALNSQIAALTQGLQLSLAKARNKLQQNQYKLISDSTDFEAEKINYKVATDQLKRQEELYKKGLVPLTALETRRLKFQEVSAKITSSENKVLAARNEVLNAMIELNSLRAEYTDKISKSQSDLSSAFGSVAEGQGDLSKLTNEYANMKIRNEQYFIIAPQDGYIVKAMKTGIGETIKEGEAVVMIMPNNPRVAVALYVKAMDVPLLSIGRKVRLQFEGWPALQFSGWPSVSVGTFGGRVEVIDAVNSKDGKYRILVSPDPEDEPWPMQIRQGSGALGWTMLDDVPIWFEIWRQLNGFPPSLKDKPDDLIYGDKGSGKGEY